MNFSTIELSQYKLYFKRQRCGHPGDLSSFNVLLCKRVKLKTHRMDNCTSTLNCTSELKSAGFAVFCILMSLVIASAILLDALTIAGLLLQSAMPRLLKVLLLNLLTASIISGIVWGVINLYGIVLVLSEISDPFDPICRVGIFLYATSSVLRMFTVATFSVAVFLVVKYGPRPMKSRSIAALVIGLWCGATCLDIHILIPYIVASQYVGGVACFPHTDEQVIRQLRYTFTAIWCTFGGLIPLAVCTAVPIICLCYIRYHTGSDNDVYKKAMAKLALFLMIGSLINILGQAVTGVITHFSQSQAVYVTYTLIVLSLLPTPIAIIIFLKPVRDALKTTIINKIGKGNLASGISSK